MHPFITFKITIKDFEMAGQNAILIFVMGFHFVHNLER